MRDLQKYLHDYGEASDDNFELRWQVPVRRKHVLEQVRKYPHRRILEVGCGWQSLGTELQLGELSQLTIVEPIKEFCEKAAQDLHGLQESGKLEVINDTLQHLSSGGGLSSKQFDFIVISGLLHELEQPEELLSCIRKISDEATVIHVNVPNANSFHRVLAYESGLISSVEEFSEANRRLQQHSVFSMDSLLELLEAGTPGIEVLDKGSYFPKLFTHKQMETCLKQGIINEAVIKGLDAMSERLPELGSEIYVNFRYRMMAG